MSSVEIGYCSVESAPLAAGRFLASMPPQPFADDRGAAGTGTRGIRLGRAVFYSRHQTNHDCWGNYGD